MEKAIGEKRPVLLLSCGVLGPLLFTVVYLIEGAVLPGYNSLRQSISELSLSNQGWFQRTNFIICGLLIGCFAVGLWLTLRSGKDKVATWGSILLAMVGVGLIFSGIFVTESYLSTPLHGRIYFFSDIAVFVLLPMACFLFARRFAGEPDWKGWVPYSVITGILMLAFFVAFIIASIYGWPVGVFERLSISIGMAWIVLLATWLLPGKLRRKVLFIFLVTFGLILTVIWTLSLQHKIADDVNNILTPSVAILGIVVALWPLIFTPSDGPEQSRLERARLDPYFFWNAGFGVIFLVALLVFIAYRLNLGAVFSAFQPSPTRAVLPSPTGLGSSNNTPWDWLQLLIVLIILTIGGIWLTIGGIWLYRKAEQRAQVERKTALDNQREKALQDYIDKMSELLLKEHLGERTTDGKLKPEYKQVRNIARVRTITVLTQLDARRVGFVFSFLRESGLMSTTADDNVVSLDGADLYAVIWNEANLREANLREANLREANLREANLSGAFLYQANLREALQLHFVSQQ